MGYNPFLPTAGARINVLCVPAGPITPDRFQKFVKALQRAARVERKAVDSAPSTGYIFYDISASQDKWRPHLFPFETNSRCQVLLGLVDCERLGNDPTAPSEGSDVSKSVESIRVRFEEQHPPEPGLTVRRLVHCGTRSGSASGTDVLSLPDNEDNTGHEVMVAVSLLLLEGLTGIINDLKDQPISMVPGSGAQTPRRTATTPNPASGASTPVSAKPPSPLPNSSGTGPQVCVQSRLDTTDSNRLPRVIPQGEDLTLFKACSVSNAGHGLPH